MYEKFQENEQKVLQKQEKKFFWAEKCKKFLLEFFKVLPKKFSKTEKIPQKFLKKQNYRYGVRVSRIKKK